MSQMIIPRYNLIITYDLEPEQEEDYYKFALAEFVPGMQGLGLYLARAWHTAYGNYPNRQSEFVAEDLKTIRKALQTDTFRRLEDRLLSYVTNYERRIVGFNDGFQL